MSADDLDVSKAPLLSHLLELRSRLIHCLLFFIVAFGLAYLVSEELYSFLQQPLVEAFGAESGRRMIYTGLHEAFFTYLKLSFFAALFVTLPLALIQLWRFIAPGLYSHEQKALVPLFMMTPVLFTAGAALAFYVVMPLAWDFFLSFENAEATGQAIRVELEARISEYLGLVLKLVFAFGISFELPILLLVMARAGLVSAESLTTYRKHALVGGFLFAAVLTPPDLVSQVALGIPIVILYELSIVLVRYQERALGASRKVAAAS